MFNLFHSNNLTKVQLNDFNSFVPNNFSPFNEDELSEITGGCEEPSLMDHESFRLLEPGEAY